MGLLRKIKGEDILPEDKSKLIDELRELNKKLAEEEGKLEAVKLTGEVNDLKKEIADLEIQASKREESFKQKEREIKHMVGLERKRSEFEREEAAKNARIEVREEALKAKEQSFEDNMKFMRERFEQEVASMREVHKQMFDLVPKVTVDRKIQENYGQLPSASSDDVEG